MKNGRLFLTIMMMIGAWAEAYVANRVPRP